MSNKDRGKMKSVCSICLSGCGIEVTLENGSIVNVQGDREHPITRGHICPKGRALGELVQLSDKIKKPLKKDSSGSFQEIEWPEALDLLSNKLNEVKRVYGPEAVVFHVGQGGVFKEFWVMMERLASAFGSPNFSSAGSLCHTAMVMAYFYTCGAFPTPDYENARCITLWGYNPQVCFPPISAAVNKGIKNGAKLIVVDPIATPAAKKADLHLQIRPGTDGALALGLLSVIISEKLYDRDFVEKWTVGFDKLESLVEQYPSERVEEITWVSADTIEQMARLYAASNPAALYSGNPLELQSNGFQGIRAISIIQAVCGNLDRKGGARLVFPHAPLDPMRLDSGSEKPRIGMEEFPLFCSLDADFIGGAQANIHHRAILENKPYPLKAMFVVAANPLLTWPNVGKVEKALRKLDFLAVMDNYLTPTAELADLFIPAATFLSRHEFWDKGVAYGVPLIGIAQKLLEDRDRVTDWEFLKQLADTMGLSEQFPWETYEAWMDDRLKPLGITFTELRDMPGGKIYAEYAEKKHEAVGFRTPSGKVEIYSEVLEKNGYNPLPVYVEPNESPLSRPDLAEKYPLVITTGTRTRHYMHSRHRDLPSLKKANPDPVLEMNPEKAMELGVNEGEKVIVESARGSIEVKVSFNPGIDPRVVSMVHGWWPSNANRLTDDEALDPVTGFPPSRAFLCVVKKKIKYH